MARQKTTMSPAPHLPAGFNAWLLDCAPAGGCQVCSYHWKQLQATKARDDMNQAVKHADQIRNHGNGHR